MHSNSHRPIQRKPNERVMIPLARRAFPKHLPPVHVLVAWKKKWPRLFPFLQWANEAFFCSREPILLATKLNSPGTYKLGPGELILWKSEKKKDHYLRNTHRFHTLTLEVV